MSSGSPPPAVPGFTGGQVALVVLGALFLLPGLCSLFFVLGTLVDFLQRGRFDEFVAPMSVLWLICFAISALGIVMIRAARKRARRSS